MVWQVEGGLGLVVAAGGRVVSPRGPRQDCLLEQPHKAGSALEADYGAPMPGHPTQGGDTHQDSRLRGVPDRGTPQTHATATPARNA